MVRKVRERISEVLSRKFLLIGLVFVTSFLTFGFLKFAFAAEAPAIVTYQGKIQVDGESATTTLSMKFVLYDSLTGGTALYSAGGTTGAPIAISVTPSAGIFSVDLGDTGTNALDVSIFKSNASVYLEVIVGSETLSPRKRITAAPYAYNAKYLDGIAASSTSPTESHIALSDSNGNFDFNNVTTTKIYNNGTLEVTGNSTLTNVSSTNITASGYLNVTATSTFTTTTANSSTINYLNVTSNANILNVSSTNMTASGFLSVVGNSTLTNVSSTNITASGYLNIAGQSTFGNVSSTNITASGYFNVTGNSTLTNVSSTNQDLSGYLTVAGNATFSATTTFATTTMTSSTITNLNVGSSISLPNNSITDAMVVDTITASNYLALAGGTMGGSIAMGGYNITGIGSAIATNVSSTYSTSTFAVLTNVSSTYIDNAGYLNVTGQSTLANVSSTNITASGYLDVVGNSYFGTVASGTWNGTIIGNTYGGTGQNSVGWNGFTKVTGGTWSAVTPASSDLSDVANIAFLDHDQTFSGTNTFSDTSIFNDSVGIGTSTPAAKMHIYDGLLLIDSPATLTRNSLFNTGVTGVVSVVVSHKYAYIADGTNGIKIIDIEKNTQIGSLDTGTAGDVKLAGDYLYVADSGLGGSLSTGLAIVDVRDPSSPQLVGSYISGGNAIKLFVVGKYVYLADGADGLKIIDISNASSPSLVGEIGAGFIQDVYVDGKYAYAADHTGAMRIIDISDPTDPTLLGLLTTTPDTSRRLFASGGYVYSMGANNKLLKIDISNPAVPFVSASTTDIGGTGDVYVSGKYAYVGCGLAGLKIIDVSATTSLSAVLPVVGTYNTAGTAAGVYVSGRYIYVADGSNGLEVLSMGGLDVHAANIGNLSSNALTVWENMDIGNNLSVRNGLNVGLGGILSNGSLSVSVSSTSATENLFTVGTSTANNFLVVKGNGYVGINSSTPTKLFSVDGDSFLNNVSSTNLTASGYLNVTGQSTLTNVSSTNITASGYLNITGNSTLTNVSSTNITASGYLNAAGQSTFGNVSSTNQTLSGYFNVTGQSTLTNVSSTNITASGYLNVTGNSTLTNVSSTNQDLSGYLKVSGNSTSTFLYGATFGTTGGLVGIGTTTPSARLHVSGGNILHTAYGNPTNLGAFNTSGTSYGVYVSGRYAYVADRGEGLSIIDIHDPESPTLAGSVDTSGEAYGIYVHGQYAYLADGSAGLQIIDVSDPTSPSIIGHVDTPGTANDIFISGKYAYIADNLQGFAVIDVSDPTSPIEVGRVDTDSNAYDVYIVGKFAYVTDSTEGLKIIDISNPSDPVIVGSADTTAAYGVYVSGKYAYVADYGVGLVIMDISDPTSPVVTSSLATLTTQANDVYVSGKYAYIADGAGGLSIINVSDIANPSLVGSVTGGGGAESIYISGKYAYVAEGTAGLQIVDINGLDTPAISTGNIATNDLTVWENVDIGNNLYIRSGLNVGMGGILSNGSLSVSVSSTAGDLTLFSVGTTTANNFLSVRSDGEIGIGTSTPDAKLHIYDGTLLVDSPTNLDVTGSKDDATGNAIEIVTDGKYAYTAYTDAATTKNLVIYDVSDVNYPTEVSTFALSATPTAMYYFNDIVYVGEVGGIEVVDVSNRAVPLSTYTLIDETCTGDFHDLYVSGKVLYASCENLATVGAIKTFDISSPRLIEELGEIILNILYDSDIFVFGKYLATVWYTPSQQLFGIYDISVPDNPFLVSSTTISTTANGSVYFSGKYAYAVDKVSDRLNIFDISDVSNIVSTTVLDLGVDSPGSIDIQVNGKYAYIFSDDNEGFSGLRIIDISSSTNPTLLSSYSMGDTQAGQVVGKYAYVADGANGLKIVDIKGADIHAANIGNIATNDLTVWENVDIGNNLYVRTGLNVGSGGVYSQGAVSINIAPDATMLAFDITATGNELPLGSTHKIFQILSNGDVIINSSTPSVDPGEYKVLIDGGESTNALGVNGIINATGAINASGGLDLAENYPINLSCEDNNSCPVAGDIVCTDATIIAGVKKCSTYGKNVIVGIVSTKPGFLLGGDFAGDSAGDSVGTVKVALTGRVPVKVSDENGAIAVGDKLTLSSIDGVAAKAVGEAPILAMAMEAFAGPGQGTVVAFVNLGWQNKLYEALTVDETNKKLTVGSELTPYDLELNGEFAMFNNTVNRLAFNSNALFETMASGTHAFVFNAVNFGNESDKYLLSLRSNSVPKFSVLANGDVHALGNIYAASAVFGSSTNPGDLAERVDIAPDDIVEPGDVLVVDEDSPDTYRRSAGIHEQAVAGVVSTNPTIVVGNGRTEYTAVMAMVGRVPVKVNGQNGAIQRGDLLVTASSTGYAMKYDPRKDTAKMVGVIGVALEPFAGENGKIMALIRTGWVNSKDETLSEMKQEIQQIATAQGMSLNASSTSALSVGNEKGQLVYTGGDLDLQGGLLLNVASVSGKDNKWAIDNEGRFITRMNTSEGEKEMYSIQSPSSEFVFSSSSQMTSGEARVVFDAQTQEIIDSNSQIKVTITLTSDAKGVFVSEKSAQGFVVTELNNGKSNATFDWMVVAKRKDSAVSENQEPSEPPAVEPPSEGSSSTESGTGQSSTPPASEPTPSSGETPAPTITPTPVPPAETPAPETTPTTPVPPAEPVAETPPTLPTPPPAEPTSPAPSEPAPPAQTPEPPPAPAPASEPPPAPPPATE